ncbi:MAG: TylF/MycF/NovP-related O-methyltransferase [Gemmatimonas sp.]
MGKLGRFVARLVCLKRFVLKGNGGAYNVHRAERLAIGLRVFRAHRALRQQSASTLGEQLFLVNAILALPKDTPGEIAEFGCFKGASSVALSIAAKHTNRKLLVFDSFEGLPEPEHSVSNIHDGKTVGYEKGAYKGTLDEVRQNITQHGEIGITSFVVGFFNETLSVRPAHEKYCAIFEDADLVSSVRDVLTYAWPKLAANGVFLCHEARDLEVVQLFYDKHFWQSEFNSAAPGLVGAGFGVPTDAGAFNDRNQAQLVFNYGSHLGYVYKS